MPNGTTQTGPPLPGWLGPVVQLTTQVGLPTLFSIILLWFVLTRLDKVFTVIESQEQARTTVVETMGASFIVALDKQATRFEQAIADNIKANEKMADLAHQERIRLLEKLGKTP